MSRTIADLEDAGNIEMHLVAQEINYRAFDRKLFGREGRVEKGWTEEDENKRVYQKF